MPVDPAQLLRRLEPAVRPGSIGRRHDPQRPIEQQDFDQLLTMVARGNVSSGRHVRCDCALDDPLTDERLERLASAADQAEAAGSDRAVMIIDGRAMVMDVPQRVIETEISARASANNDAAGSATVFGEVDAAVYVPHEDDAITAALPPIPGNGLVPGTVARQLERALLLGDSAGGAQQPTPAQRNDETRGSIQREH